MNIIKNEFRMMLIYLGKLAAFCFSYVFFAGASKESNIFLFIPYYHIGGAEQVHFNIAKCLSDRKPIIFFTKESYDVGLKEFFKKYASVNEIGKYVRNRFIRYLFIGYISQLINKHEDSIVFGSNSEFFYVLLPHLSDHVKKIDLIHAIGGWVETVSLPYLKYINKRIIINEKLKEDLTELYLRNDIHKEHLDRIQVIENEVFVPEIYTKKDFKEIKILYVGRDSEQKRINLITRIAQRCFEKYGNITFLFVGDLKDGISQPDHEFCKFLGIVYDSDKLADIYKSAHMILITSKREGFPLAIMEGMAYGVIPITTDVGAISTHITNDFNGILIQNSDDETLVDSFVNQISCLLDTKNRFNEISLNAYQYALDHFKSSVFCDNYTKIFL